MEKDKSWTLAELKVEYQRWGEHKGKHTGKVKFENSTGDSFQFILTPEKTERFIDLIAFELVIQGNDLGKNLLESIGLDRALSLTPPAPPPKPQGRTLSNSADSAD